MKFKIIKGGKDISSSDKYILAKGEITDTRLMGVLGMHLHWTIPEEGDYRDLHQFFYYDIEELGLEELDIYNGNDVLTINMAQQSRFGGLGAEMKLLSEREARWAVCRMISETRRMGHPLPPEAESLAFITEHPVILSDEERRRLMLKCSVSVKTDFGVVNYYLMRLFGKDREGAQLLIHPQADPADLEDMEPEKHCTFLRNSIKPCEDAEGGMDERSYISESLVIVDSENSHRIVISEVKVRDGKVVAVAKLSDFRISETEASMKLSKDEYVNVYEIKQDVDLFDAEFAFYSIGMMKTRHDNGIMHMEFRKDNSHVERDLFELSEDLRALYFVTDFGQLIVAGNDRLSIDDAERRIKSDKISKMIYPTGRYRFTNPVLFEFAQSGYDDFEDFLKSLE